MDWIIFADDWGAHIATTQHLVRHFPKGDRVVWINSIGMRSPRLALTDIKRLIEKGTSILFAKAKPQTTKPNGQLPFELQIVHPSIAPWHLKPEIAAANRMILSRQIRTATRKLKLTNPVVLSANPVAVQYLSFDHQALVYLRLDEYDKLPGVDPQLVHKTESMMMGRAEAIFATARQLLPNAAALKSKSHYLPQGVDADHFAQIPLEVPHKKTLGFFGLLAEWIDYDLIEQVADLRPDWSLEFIGPVRFFPDRLKSKSNIKLLDPVPYESLPNSIVNWRAAWIPFEISDLTAAVNPLKLREYLAAGLPTLSTPLPEAQGLDTEIKLVAKAQDVSAVLDDIEANDTPEHRAQRRASMASHSWQSRSAQLRQVISNLG